MDSRRSRSRRHAPEREISGCGVAEVTTDWREENTPVVMAGIVGSNVGWRVARILSVPARFSSLGERLRLLADRLDYCRIMRFS
ncbi:2-dehydro-3-deoxygalactonokinase [Shigella sonnei]